MLSKKMLPLTPQILKASYATVAPDHWPRHSHRPPTPYQILNIDTKAPYSKTRFNELVKMYHPDLKPHPACAHLPPAERLDRYHKIIAAHALLSDPEKRRLYDLYGLGWGVAENPVSPFRGRMDRDPNGAATAARNATWEDWEQWREERAREKGEAMPKQAPVYMSNGSFVALLFVFTMGAAAAQTMHAETLTERRRILREENHWKSVQDIERKRAEARSSTREERIEGFLSKRDPAVLTNKNLTRMMTNPDLCLSGDDVGRDKDLDMRPKVR